MFCSGIVSEEVGITALVGEEGPGDIRAFGVSNGQSEIQFTSRLLSKSISVDTNMIYAPRQFREPFFDSTKPIWR